MNLLKIREASLDDVPSLAALSTQLGYPSTPQQIVDRLSVILPSRDQLVLVACLPNDTIVGWTHAFIACRIESESFAEIGGLVVAENHRGRGIGTLLIAAAEDWAKHHGTEKLRVRSRSTRHAAHVFYERLGFARSKEQLVLDKLIKPSC